MITYYYLSNSNCSYSLVARKHINSLKKLGYEIVETDITRIIPNEVALIHPLSFLRNGKGIENFAKYHSYLIGFQTSDTERIGQNWVNLLNNPKIKLIITPSTYSATALRNSGVVNRIKVIPHGVAKEFRPLNIKHQGIRALTFIQHNPFRKGEDIFRKLVDKFPEIDFKVKGPNDRWMTETELVKFYNTFDIYLALQRGGSFEMNPLEALACGLIVISNAYGCVLDYLNEKNSILVPIKGKVKLFENGVNPNEIGDVCEPDIDKWYEKLQWCLDNLKMLKERAVINSKEIRERYSWDKIAMRIIESINEIRG